MTLATWNGRQVRVMVRLQRLFRVELTPDAVQQLGARYAAKHEAERSQPETREEASMPVAMIGPEVKRLRMTLGMVQEELAARLLVSVRQVKRYEAEGIPGQATLRADRLRRMARAKEAGRKLKV